MMLSFKEFCNVNEGAGSLAGLPKEFIKQITSRRNRGGENSEIELYKKNAKQKDLTAAVKIVSEANSNSNNYKYAGVLVKVNDVWSFYAEYEEYAKKFFLISPEGYKAKKTTSTRYKQGSKPIIDRFNTTELSAADLSIFINFSDDIVDIYLVTADVERLNKIAARNNAKKLDNISPEKKAALQKFLNKQAGEALSYAKTTLTDKAKELTDSLQQNINPETMTFNIKAAEAAIAKFNDDTYNLLRDYKTVVNRINDIITYDSNIKINNSKYNTIRYDGFKNAVNNLSKYVDNSL